MNEKLNVDIDMFSYSLYCALSTLSFIKWSLTFCGIFFFFEWEKGLFMNLLEYEAIS